MDIKSYKKKTINHTHTHTHTHIQLPKITFNTTTNLEH